MKGLLLLRISTSIFNMISLWQHHLGRNFLLNLFHRTSQVPVLEPCSYHTHRLKVLAMNFCIAWIYFNTGQCIDRYEFSRRKKNLETLDAFYTLSCTSGIQ